jgi:hypothetical protein
VIVGMRMKPPSSAAGFAVAATAAALLSACSTTQVAAPPVPTAREAPIHSLALEQCIGENGEAQCTAARP